MNHFFTLALLNAAVMGKHNFSKQDEGAFLGFAAQYSKDYKDLPTMEKKLDLFLQHRDTIQAMNRRAKGVTFGVNAYCDKTKQEYFDDLKLIVPVDAEAEAEKRRGLQEANADEGRQLQAEKSIDWSKTEYMIPVKNQQGCGSCWAFAATSVMEGMQAIATSSPAIRLSEQEAVDCTPASYGCYGCNGGWMDGYWKWTKSGSSNPGAQAYNTYAPYNARDNECRDQGNQKISKMATTGNCGNLSGMKQKIREGPLAVAMDVSCDAFMYYESGVLDRDMLNEFNCVYNRVNHAMTIVGVHFAGDEGNDGNDGNEGNDDDGNDGNDGNDGDGNDGDGNDGDGNDEEEKDYVCRKASKREKKKKSCDGPDEKLMPNKRGKPNRKCCIEVENFQLQTHGMNEGVSNQDAHKTYWIVQNSWGTWWGKDGFIKVALEDSKYGLLGENTFTYYMTTEL